MSDQVSFVVYLPAKEGRLEAMKEHLFGVVHTMSTEADFINTWIHVSQDEPNTIVLYETWACTKEYFISHHLAKPYRQAYEKLLPELLAAERRLEFLDIIKSYPERRVA